MLKRLWIWWNKVRFYFKPLPIENIMMATDHKEITCTRDRSTRLRVEAAFRAQRQEMEARALKAHECEDLFNCTREPCFIRVPDKIVDKTYKVEKHINK